MHSAELAMFAIAGGSHRGSCYVFRVMIVAVLCQSHGVMAMQVVKKEKKKDRLLKTHNIRFLYNPYTFAPAANWLYTCSAAQCVLRIGWG